MQYSIDIGAVEPYIGPPVEIRVVVCEGGSRSVCFDQDVFGKSEAVYFDMTNIDQVIALLERAKDLYNYSG